MALGARLQTWSSCFYCATWFVFLGKEEKMERSTLGEDLKVWDILPDKYCLSLWNGHSTSPEKSLQACQNAFDGVNML